MLTFTVHSHPHTNYTFSETYLRTRNENEKISWPEPLYRPHGRIKGRF